MILEGILFISGVTLNVRSKIVCAGFALNKSNCLIIYKGKKSAAS